MNEVLVPCVCIAFPKLLFDADCVRRPDIVTVSLDDFDVEYDYPLGYPRLCKRVIGLLACSPGSTFWVFWVSTFVSSLAFGL
jgi:hypothetical protein